MGVLELIRAHPEGETNVPLQVLEKLDVSERGGCLREMKNSCREAEMIYRRARSLNISRDQFEHARRRIVARREAILQLEPSPSNERELEQARGLKESTGESPNILWLLILQPQLLWVLVLWPNLCWALWLLCPRR